MSLTNRAEDLALILELHQRLHALFVFLVLPALPSLVYFLQDDLVQFNIVVNFVGKLLTYNLVNQLLDVFVCAIFGGKIEVNKK